MAWFRNYYKCVRCGSEWTDEWSCMCDDDCRQCGARHMSPYNSDDLTEIVRERMGALLSSAHAIRLNTPLIMRRSQLSRQSSRQKPSWRAPVDKA
jgi:predicted  nucleic acid-binding Zn-ribbon protein